MSPRIWSGILGALIGLTVGIGGYTFVYAKGFSYLGNDPATCANCHVMHEQYDGWVKSSHSAVATCNDCHTPDNLIGKYVTKASNGFWHSFYFTVGFADPIRIKPANRRVTEAQCRHCHGEMVEAIEHGPIRAAELSCLTCHHSVGHPGGLGNPNVTSLKRD
jgi:cytochrome c nitrite reductase small subunit